jgi:hypothetical protein
MPELRLVGVVCAALAQAGALLAAVLDDRLAIG